MATNARKKLNKMTPSEAIIEMIEWEDKGQTANSRYRQLKKLYPQIENPKLVVEKTQQSSPPQRVLYGTLDNGAICIAWNL